MAYKTTTKTYVVEDHYDGGSADRWQRATLKVTVDANGNGSWKITMNNDSSVNGYGTGRAVYLKVLIDGDYIAGSASSSYTTHGSDLDAPGYREYPCGNNTSDSGILQYLQQVLMSQ
jgi:hypothetical protein